MSQWLPVVPVTQLSIQPGTAVTSVVHNPWSPEITIFGLFPTIKKETINNTITAHGILFSFGKVRRSLKRNWFSNIACWNNLWGSGGQKSKRDYREGSFSVLVSQTFNISVLKFKVPWLTWVIAYCIMTNCNEIENVRMTEEVWNVSMKYLAITYP